MTWTYRVHISIPINIPGTFGGDLRNFYFDFPVWICSIGLSIIPSIPSIQNHSSISASIPIALHQGLNESPNKVTPYNTIQPSVVMAETVVVTNNNTISDSTHWKMIPQITSDTLQKLEDSQSLEFVGEAVAIVDEQDDYCIQNKDILVHRPRYFISQ